jgi:hypothetical protein
MPQISNEEHCGAASFTLNASALSDIYWYSDSLGMNLIHTGNTYTTPVLANTTHFYLRTELINTAFGGRLNNSGTGAHFSSSFAHGLIFNCTAPTILKSVKVYANGAGNRTIRLENSNGTLIDSRTINIPDGESRVTLNMNIPAGTNLKLMGPTSPNLFRNGSQTMNIGYPIAAGNNISIVRSTAQSYETNYYYYFYDWEVEEICESALKKATAFVLSNPTASFSLNQNSNTVAFQNTSNGEGLSFHWDFGDGASSNIENPTHTYTANGTYTITLTVTNLCNSDIYTNQVNITTTGLTEFEANVIVYPNPTSSFVVVESPEIIQTIEVMDAQGAIVFKAIPQKTKYEIDLVNLASGMYLLRIVTEEQTITKPVHLLH